MESTRPPQKDIKILEVITVIGSNKSPATRSGNNYDVSSVIAARYIHTYIHTYIHQIDR